MGVKLDVEKHVQAQNFRGQALPPAKISFERVLSPQDARRRCTG